MLLHGSRSGHPLTVAQEFESTDDWAINPSNVLGWHATVGEGIISIHIPPGAWGWNAFEASKHYVAIEYAQPLESYAISDLMVRTGNWYLARVARPAHPAMPMLFRSHAEVEANGEIEHEPSGKTDVFSFGSPRMNDLRRRIVANLRDEWGIAT